MLPDDLQDRFEVHLGDLRAAMALRERCNAISKELEDGMEAYIKAAKEGQPSGVGPLEKLKLEALASILVLSAFHCRTAAVMAQDGNLPCAHSWSRDEGALQSAFLILQGIDVSSTEVPK